MQTITKELVQSWLPAREPDAHKGDFGRVLVWAGGPGMMGACVLACRGAFRSGAGLVAAACPAEFFPAVHAGVPEATCVIREGADLSRYDAVAAGPGLGVDRENYGEILHILDSYTGPMVLDADGLNCLSEFGVPSTSRIRANLILTPHAGEAAKLANAGMEEGSTLVSPAEVAADRALYGKFLARRLGAVCVMKGAGSLVCCPDGRIFENTSGNAGMAAGGSGDVLTGMIVSLAGQLAAQGLPAGEAAVRAAVCGVFLHGLAGDIAAQRWGQAGLMASDIAEAAALAQKDLDLY